jgi:hypothetical protein
MTITKGLIVIGMFSIMASLFPYVTYTQMSQAMASYDVSRKVAALEPNGEMREHAQHTVEKVRKPFDDAQIRSYRLRFHVLVGLGVALIITGALTPQQRRHERAQQDLRQVSSKPAPEGAAPNEPSR